MALASRAGILPRAGGVYTSHRARRGPDRDRHAVPRGRLRRPRRRSARSARTSSTTARTGSSSRARPARRRRSHDDERLALYEAALEAVGDRRPSSRAPAPTRPAHSIHLTRRAARARGRRLPRRDPVLQQAAAARDRGARRRGRGGDRPADPLLRHPVAGRRRRGAGDDHRSSPRSRTCAA